MAELRDLYQEVILDHGKNPRNFRAMDEPHVEAQGYNPLCGDRVTVFVHVEHDKLVDVSFQGSGCAISTASASMMSEALKGASLAEARRLFDRFSELVTGKLDPNAGSDLGKLIVFAGVSEFPVRVKCATLPWHTFKASLSKNEASVSTE